MFFNIVLVAVLSLQIIAAIAVNSIMPGAGSLVAKLVQTAIVGFIVSTIVGGLAVLLLIGLDAVLKSVVPASDSFWAEGAGLDVIGAVGDVTAILVNWEKINKPGMSISKGSQRARRGLVGAFLGRIGSYAAFRKLRGARCTEFVNCRRSDCLYWGFHGNGRGPNRQTSLFSSTLEIS